MHKQIVVAILASVMYSAAPAAAQRVVPTTPCTDPVLVAMARKPIGEMTRSEYQAFSELEYACRQYRQRQIEAGPAFQLPATPVEASRALPAATRLAYRKDPAAATLFSFPLVGGGHFYTGETGKAFTLVGISILGQIVGYVSLAVAVKQDSEAWLIPASVGFLSSGVAHLYGIFDARPSARRMNRLNGYPEPARGVRR